MVKLENGDLGRTTISVWREVLAASIRAGATILHAVDNADLAVAHFRVRFSDDIPNVAQERSLAVAMQNESAVGLRVCSLDSVEHPIGTVKEVSPASGHQHEDMVRVEWDNEDMGEDWVEVRRLRCVKNEKFEDPDKTD